jgi:LPLT family lysophospholipid transporter-like MFS transporter
MTRGFFTIMAAQFFSSLADNALLIAAMAMLVEMHGPAWLTPLLKFSFAISYVVLAFAVGAFADAMPKGRVMFVTNAVKVAGCALILFNEFLRVGDLPAYWLVLLAYAVVGLGAAAYSPAKYGILTELLPPEMLVVANGWIEGLTVASIVLGNVVGGLLMGPELSGWLLGFDLPFIETSVDTSPEAAVVVIGGIYIVAALFNLAIPDTGARYPHQERHPLRLLQDFSRCFGILWRDKLGQISLAVTTLFWGVGVSLNLMVIEWAQVHLRMPFEHAVMLPGVFAAGSALGFVAAARFIPLRRALDVLPAGILMGITVVSMVSLRSLPVVYLALAAIGAMAGFFVVPMNALLQHRGHVLMSAGHSIAVQNFNENGGILLMLAIYALMLRMELRIQSIIVIFGLATSALIYVVMRWNAANHRADPSLDQHIGETKQR